MELPAGEAALALVGGTLLVSAPDVTTAKPIPYGTLG